jgi:hypothetical protein
MWFRSSLRILILEFDVCGPLKSSADRRHAGLFEWIITTFMWSYLCQFQRHGQRCDESDKLEIEIMGVILMCSKIWIISHMWSCFFPIQRSDR